MIAEPASTSGLLRRQCEELEPEPLRCAGLIRKSVLALAATEIGNARSFSATGSSGGKCSSSSPPQLTALVPSTALKRR